MKKKLLLIACCVTLGLTGCGGGSSTESDKKAEATTTTAEDTKASEEAETEEAKTEEAKTEETEKQEAASNTKESTKTSESKPVSDADIKNGNPEVGTVTAYREDGSEVLLTENTDGTYLAGDGITYYLGNDGIYRSKGQPDLYANKPAKSDNSSSNTITNDQALKAIRKYCYANDPSLEEIINSGDNTAYFDVSNTGSGEIVVLYRSYTAAEMRYYINPSSGEVYVTELVPGVIDNEQKTGESFNIANYMD